jgi:hypothetical protein
MTTSAILESLSHIGARENATWGDDILESLNGPKERSTWGNDITFYDSFPEHLKVYEGNTGGQRDETIKYARVPLNKKININDVVSETGNENQIRVCGIKDPWTFLPTNYLYGAFPLYVARWRITQNGQSLPIAVVISQNDAYALSKSFDFDDKFSSPHCVYTSREWMDADKIWQAKAERDDHISKNFPNLIKHDKLSKYENCSESDIYSLMRGVPKRLNGLAINFSAMTPVLFKLNNLYDDVTLEIDGWEDIQYLPSGHGHPFVSGLCVRRHRGCLKDITDVFANYRWLINSLNYRPAPTLMPSPVCPGDENIKQLFSLPA